MTNSRNRNLSSRARNVIVTTKLENKFYFSDWSPQILILRWDKKKAIFSLSFRIFFRQLIFFLHSSVRKHPWGRFSPPLWKTESTMFYAGSFKTFFLPHSFSLSFNACLVMKQLSPKIFGKNRWKCIYLVCLLFTWSPMQIYCV